MQPSLKKTVSVSMKIRVVTNRVRMRVCCRTKPNGFVLFALQLESITPPLPSEGEGLRDLPLAD
jgi:hypothetical protein